jgi:phenylalanyl-tRNA synthetase beta chain
MLCDFVATDLSAEAIGDLLTMAGFELEGIEEVEGDSVLDIKVCSNRGDGLSVFGLAREVLAKDQSAKPTELYARANNRFASVDDATPSALEVPIKIESPDCTRFAYRGFRGIPNGEAPDWIQKRLRQAGQRAISLFVDLTNYVMLEVGQPLHAYDLAKLRGPEIVVRSARAGEKITTLNGVTHELQPGQMMICDAGGPIGVAGVMGGGESEVDSQTQEVLLEAAHFVNTSVRKTRNQLGLNTDASYRFERSVDPENVVAALNRVRDLLAESGSADGCLPGVTDLYVSHPQPAAVRLRRSRAEMLLGMPLTAIEVTSYLAALGFQVAGKGDEIAVTPPTWRPDVTREEDLVEELGRVHGYERIPEVLPFGATVMGGVHGQYRLEEVLIDGALRLGFDQAITNSLCGESRLDSSSRAKIPIRTPGSADTASLRNTLLPGLADVQRRNGGAVHLFELGPIFDDPFRTLKSLALLSCGPLTPRNRQGEAETSADFFSLKSVVEHLGELAGQDVEFEPSRDDARFHPQRQAKLTGGEWQGVIGQVHPIVARACGIPSETYMAEIDLGVSKGAPTQLLKPVSRYPAIRRDVAFAISKSVPYARIEAAIKSALTQTLEDLWLFDVYEGKGIAEGEHSLALALTLRKQEGSFTDEEANREREKAVAALAALGAQMR